MDAGWIILGNDSVKVLRYSGQEQIRQKESGKEQSEMTGSFTDSLVRAQSKDQTAEKNGHL
jgi:hypothetical protein